MAARRPEKIVGAVWAPTAGRFVGIGERVSLGHSGHGQIASIATDLHNISVGEVPSCSYLCLGRHIKKVLHFRRNTRPKRVYGENVDHA